MGRKKYFYDYSLVFAVFFVLGFGLLMMYSISPYMTRSSKNTDQLLFFKKQLFFATTGFLIMITASKINYYIYAKLVIPMYIISLILQAMTLVIGASSHGSSRWLGVGGYSFQPSEVTKVTVIITIAVLITHHGFRMNKFKTARNVLFFAIPPFVLVAINNLSTGLIVLAIAVIMIFISRKQYRFFIIFSIFVIIVCIFAEPIAKALASAHIIKGYQLTRILAWKNPSDYPDDTYQTLQGLYAIGSGGFMGKGLGESIQKFLMPEAQNDMIFSIICEEMGLFGATLLISMYSFIVYRMYDIARNAKDLFGSMLVIGIMVHISLQVILNIAVVSNTIPNTGVTLPFVSYGGSSLWMLLFEMGIVLSVSNSIRYENI